MAETSPSEAVLKSLPRFQSTPEGEKFVKEEAAEVAKKEAYKEKARKVVPHLFKEGSIDPESVNLFASLFKDSKDVTFKKIDADGYHHALIRKKADGSEDIWYQKYTALDGPNRNTARWVIHFVHKDDPEMISHWEGYFHKQLDMLRGSIVQSLDDARENIYSERNDLAEVKKFDLPKDKPIGYLCFNGFGKKDSEDPNYFKTEIDRGKVLPELLTRCGYDMVCADDVQKKTPVKKLGENSAQYIEQEVEKLYQKGVRNFYLNFLAHGLSDATWVEFESNGKKVSEPISGQDFRKILTKYQDCTFAIHTVACRGGGLIGMMREFEDNPEAQPGRVTVFTEAKEGFDGGANLYGSRLISVLAAMADHVEGAPKTYGEAHYRADIKTRHALYSNDPEFWKSMPGEKSKRTAKNDSLKLDSNASPSLAAAVTQYLGGYSPLKPSDDSVPHHDLPGIIKNPQQNNLS